MSDLEQLISRAVKSLAPRLKGEKGDKGDSVKPTASELMSAVNKYMATNRRSFKGEKGDDGDQGSPGKNGEDADNDLIINKVLSRIPKPKEGVDGFTPRHEVSDDKVRFENPDKSWGQWIDFGKLIKKAVSGLRPVIQTHNQRIMGSTGLWQHESFSTSSATTVISVERAIAGRGTVALVRYQGQVLAYNVQYTVNARDITFTFTLEDNTTVDVSYVGI